MRLMPFLMTGVLKFNSRPKDLVNLNGSIDYVSGNLLHFPRYWGEFPHCLSVSSCLSGHFAPTSLGPRLFVSWCLGGYGFSLKICAV